MAARGGPRHGAPASFFCRRRTKLQLVLLTYLFFSGQALAADSKERPASLPYDSIDRYAAMRIEGWKVLVNKMLWRAEHDGLRAETLELLGDHLYRIRRVVPAGPLQKLRQVPIWVELAHPRHPCMCYHTSPGWLREHGMNPAKAGGVELSNCKNFLVWTHQQPWMVLHELAHAYHDKVLGFDNAEVRACFDQALSLGVYQSVRHISGHKVRHYAMTNDREYFAEATEAFFGTNDFYPFVRAELKEVDPRMDALLEKVWGTRREKGERGASAPGASTDPGEPAPR